MTADTGITFTPAQVAHREACAFLKGILCGYADGRGRRYVTTKQVTDAFRAGFIEGHRAWPETVTQTHVLHNRLRHSRPHTSTEAELFWSFAGSLLRDFLGETAEIILAQAREGIHE